jgi:hypothetical protein
MKDEFTKTLRILEQYSPELTAREHDLIKIALTMGDAQTAAQWIIAHRIDVRNGTICTPNAGELRNYMKCDEVRAMHIYYNRHRANGMRMLVTERMQDKDGKTFNTREMHDARLNVECLNEQRSDVRGRHVDAAVAEWIAHDVPSTFDTPDHRQRWKNAYSLVRRNNSERYKEYQREQEQINRRCMRKLGFDFRTRFAPGKLAPGVSSLPDLLKALELKDEWHCEYYPPTHTLRMKLSKRDYDEHGAAIKTWVDLNGGATIHWNVVAPRPSMADVLSAMHSWGEVPIGDGYALRVSTPDIGQIKRDDFIKRMARYAMPPVTGPAMIDDAMKRLGVKWYRTTFDPARCISEVFVTESDLSSVVRECEKYRTPGWLIEYRILRR